MQHRLLGGSGLRISRLCLGTLTFGEKKAWGANPGEARSILESFANAGGTFIDTAPNYGGGAAEEIVGSFIAGGRDDFTIATKYTASECGHPLAGGNSRKSMRRSVEDSLKRLQTDHIDLLWLHFWDGTTPLDEILRSLDDLVHAGKILYAGMSDTPAWLISRAATIASLSGIAPVTAIQLEYNLAARTPENELLPMAKALDLGTICWSPLGAGALTGSSQHTRLPRLAPRLAAAAEQLTRIAADTQTSEIQLALGWLMARGHIPVVGVRTADQLKTALLAEPVDSALLEHLDAIAPPEPCFPQTLIASSYLRRFAFGDPSSFDLPNRARS